MAVGAVSMATDNGIISGTATVTQPVTGVDSTFSEALNSSVTQSRGNADLDTIFEAAGRKYDIPPNLLKAVAKVESNLRPNVTSTAGAMGIMQLMPGTARGLGVTDAFDPEQNIMGGAKYLRQMLDRFDGDLRLALGAYNAGPGAVAKHGGVPSFSQNYVSKVLGFLDGGDITAGTVSYNGFDAFDQKGAVPESFNFGEALAQMIFAKLIEMQMNSSNDDNNRIF